MISLRLFSTISTSPKGIPESFFCGASRSSPGFVESGVVKLSASLCNKVLNRQRSRHSSILGCGTNHKGVKMQAHIKMMQETTPEVFYEGPGVSGGQWIDLWNALYRERVIFIGDELSEETSNQILATLLYLDSVDPSETIHFYITGRGGDLTPALTIYDTLHSIKCPIATYCVSYAYGLGAFLLAAGTKGKRYAMPLSRIALQPPAGTAHGQADDIRNETEELLRIRDYLFGELAKNTGQPVERISEDVRRVKRFTAQEALEYGLIDHIVRPSEIKEMSAQQGQEDHGAGMGFQSF